MERVSSGAEFLASRFSYMQDAAVSGLIEINFGGNRDFAHRYRSQRRTFLYEDCGLPGNDCPRSRLVEEMKFEPEMAEDFCRSGTARHLL